LAPEIVEAILGGRQPAEMTLAVLMRPFPVGGASSVGSYWISAGSYMAGCSSRILSVKE
jgi:hypothetical protein